MGRQLSLKTLIVGGAVLLLVFITLPLIWVAFQLYQGHLVSLVFFLPVVNLLGSFVFSPLDISMQNATLQWNNSQNTLTLQSKAITLQAPSYSLTGLLKPVQVVMKLHGGGVTVTKVTIKNLTFHGNDDATPIKDETENTTALRGSGTLLDAGTLRGSGHLEYQKSLSKKSFSLKGVVHTMVQKQASVSKSTGQKNTPPLWQYKLSLTAHGAVEQQTSIQVTLEDFKPQLQSSRAPSLLWQGDLTTNSSLTKLEIKHIKWNFPHSRGRITGSMDFANTRHPNLPIKGAVNMSFMPSGALFPFGFSSQSGFQKGSLKFHFDPVNETLVVDSFTLKGVHQGSQGNVTLWGSIPLTHEDAPIHLKGELTQLPVAMIKGLWPTFLASNARTWVADNLHEGLVRQGSFHLTAPRTLVQNAPLPKDSLNLQLAFSDVTVAYLSPLPPLKIPSMTLNLTNHDFRAEFAEGYIPVFPNKKIHVSNGSMYLPSFADVVGIPSQFSFTTQSGLQPLLKLLARPPLEIGQQSQKFLHGVFGDTITHTKLFLPLIKNLSLKDDVKLEGTGTTTRLALRHNLPASLHINNGKIHYTFTQESITAEGEVSLPEGNGKGRLRLMYPNQVSITASANIRAQLLQELAGTWGLKSNHGSIKARVALKSTPAANKGTLTLDLTAPQISFSPMNWQKPAASSAHVQASFTPTATGFDFSAITAKAMGLAVQGTAKFGENTALLQFPRVSFGAQAHNSLTWEKSAHKTDIKIKGQFINATEILNNFITFEKDSTKSDSTKCPPLCQQDMSFSFDKVELYNAVLNRFALTYNKQQDRIKDLQLHATFKDGEEFHITSTYNQELATITLAPTHGRNIYKMFGIDNIIDSRLVKAWIKIPHKKIPPQKIPYKKTPPPPPQILHGEISMENIKIYDMPILLRVLALSNIGSLGGQNNKEALFFTEGVIPFRIKNSTILIKEAYVTKPALRITSYGAVHLKDEKVFMAGTVVPFYLANSLPSRIPFFGRFLSGGKGEGIFGTSYTITGNFSDLAVEVDALSVITPGFTRQLFNLTGESLEALEEAPKPLPRGSDKRQKYRDR